MYVAKRTGQMCTCTRICARTMCTDKVTRLTLHPNDRDAPILVRGRPGGRTPQVDAEASLFIGRKIWWNGHDVTRCNGIFLSPNVPGCTL